MNWLDNWKQVWSLPGWKLHGFVREGSRCWIGLCENLYQAKMLPNSNTRTPETHNFDAQTLWKPAATPALMTLLSLKTPLLQSPNTSRCMLIRGYYAWQIIKGLWKCSLLLHRVTLLLLLANWPGIPCIILCLNVFSYCHLSLLSHI